MAEMINASVSEDNRILVECLDDYIIAINKMRKQVQEEEGAGSDNQHFFFRGQANEAWDIIPGIFRGGMLAFEGALIQTAFLRNPSDFRGLGSNFERLTKLQHYGLPTRLLDVTSNPLVALYFACQPHKEYVATEADEREYSEETDGAVFFQRAYCKGYDELEIMLHAHIAGMDIHGDMTLEYLLDNLEEHGIYTSKAATKCREMNYRSLIEILQNNYFVVSNLNNDRLIRQSGAFLVCGQYNIIIDENDRGRSVLQKANGGLRSEFDETYFYIPVNKKKAILDELDFYNINEGALFPELEHQMTYIKNVQSGKTAQTIGTFSKVIFEQEKKEIEVVPVIEIDDKKAATIMEKVVREKIDVSLQQRCLEIANANMTIDWFRKENVQSKIRLELAKMLETTSQYDRGSAKKKAQEIMSEVISNFA